MKLFDHMNPLDFMPNWDDPRWMVYVRDEIDAQEMIKFCIPLPVEPGEAYRFRGDLYAFLRYKGYPAYSFFPTLLVNEALEHPTDFDETINMLMIIPEQHLQSLFAHYNEHVVADFNLDEFDLNTVVVQ